MDKEILGSSRNFLKKYWIILAIVILLVCYLVFASRIVALLSGAYFAKINGNALSYELESVNFELNRIEASETDFFNRVNVYGWACCGKEVEPEKKKIGIVLESEEGTLYSYEVIPSMERSDLPAAKKRQGKSNMGFECAPSLALVPDGVYNVLVYCYECETNYGITRTAYALTKKHNEVSVNIRKNGIKTEMDSNVKIYTDADAYISSVAANEAGRVQATGWAHVADAPSGLQEVILCAIYPNGEKAYYATEIRTRADLVYHFDDDDYWSSGFYAELPEDTNVEECSYALIIKNSSGYHTTPSMWVKLGFWRSEVVELKIEKISCDANLYSSQSSNESSDTTVISGWAYVQNQDADGQTVYVRFDYETGEYDIFTAQSYSRIDIAKKFENELYTMCGFMANIPNELIRNQNYSTSVIIKNSTGLHTTVKSGLSFGLLFSEKIDLKEAEVIGDADLYVGKNTINDDGTCIILGWAYVPNQDTQNQKIYIRLNYKKGGYDIFTAQSFSRKDIAEHFGNNLYQMCGFGANIPDELRKSDNYSVTILIENEKGIHTTMKMLEELNQISKTKKPT